MSPAAFSATSGTSASRVVSTRGASVIESREVSWVTELVGSAELIAFRTARAARRTVCLIWQAASHEQLPLHSVRRRCRRSPLGSYTTRPAWARSSFPTGFMGVPAREAERPEFEYKERAKLFEVACECRRGALIPLNASPYSVSRSRVLGRVLMRFLFSATRLL